MDSVQLNSIMREVYYLGLSEIYYLRCSSLRFDDGYSVITLDGSSV